MFYLFAGLLACVFIILLIKKINEEYGNKIIQEVLQDADKGRWIHFYKKESGVTIEPWIPSASPADTGNGRLEELGESPSSPSRSGTAARGGIASGENHQDESAAGDPLKSEKTATSTPNSHSRLMKIGIGITALLVAILIVRSLIIKDPVSDLSGPVVKVIDGDTIEILGQDRRTTKVRLYGIDSPEIGQPFGDSARQVMSDLAVNKTARVFVKDYDNKYGRVVGEVKVGKIDLGGRLVEEGQAWAYRYYSDRYVRSEEKAKQKRKGLWRDSQPMAPWDWRRKMKSASY